MGRKQELGGIELDLCSMEEMRADLENFFHTEQLNIIDLIVMRTIVSANEDTEVLEIMKKFDRIFPDDRDVLHQLENISEEMVREVQEHEFFRHLMAMSINERYGIYILTETEDEMEGFLEYLDRSYGEHPQIVGNSVLEQCDYNMEVVVNEINSLVPHLILAVLNSPLQEYVIGENASMLNAKLWVGITENTGWYMKTGIPKRLYEQFVLKRKLKRQMQQAEGETK